MIELMANIEPRGLATRRLGSVQALRAVAALLVVVFHIGSMETRFAGGYSLVAPLGDLGRLGVYIFFVISGFIMITTNWQEFGKPSAPKRFLLRRIVRIVPPYWIVSALLLVVFIKAPHLMNSSSRYPTSVVDSFLLLPQRGYALLMVGWTLVFEMYFYYVFTIALAFARRYFGFIVLGWLVAMIALHAAAAHHPYNVYLWLVGDPANLFFIAGIVTGYFVLNGKVRAPLTCAALGLVLTPVIYYSHWSGFIRNVPLNSWIGVLITAAPIALMLYGFVTSETAGKLRFYPRLVLVGDASYALYLWHVPVLSALARVFARLPLRSLPLHIAGCLAAVVFTVWFSIQIYRFVERPLLRYLDARLNLREHAAVVPALTRTATADVT